MNYAVQVAKYNCAIGIVAALFMIAMSTPGTTNWITGVSYTTLVDSTKHDPDMYSTSEINSTIPTQSVVSDVTGSAYNWMMAINVIKSVVFGVFLISAVVYGLLNDLGLLHGVLAPFFIAFLIGLQSIQWFIAVPGMWQWFTGKGDKTQG